MPNHHKPTPEELQAEIDKAQAELDKQTKEPADPPEKIDPPTPDPEPKEPPTPDPKEKKETPPAKEGEEPAEGDNPPDPKEKKEEAKAGEPDYKEKFSNSSREAHRLFLKNQRYNAAVDAANGLPAPTDEELKAEFPEWEEMSATERRLATDNLVNKRRWDAVNKVAEQEKKVETWNKTVDSFIEDPKTLIAHPELEGKQADFKIFAAKEERMNYQFDDIVDLFLAKMEKETVKHKGEMFPRGNSGPNARPAVKTDKLTLAQADLLRKTNYAKYREALKAGKIGDE